MQLEPRERLIVALDVPSVEAAQAMVARLGDAVAFYKIGYQLAFAGGLPMRRRWPTPASGCFSISSSTTSATPLREGVESVARLGATFSPCTPIRRP